MMKCPNLLHALEQMIVNELLTPLNASQFYIDAILFQAKPIFDACETIIQSNINQIIENEKESEFLMNLPFERMQSLCKEDRLQVANESVVLKLIDKYLETRDSNKNLPKLAEEYDGVTAPKKNWDLLVEQGVLTSEEGLKKKEDEVKKFEEEAKKNEDERIAKEKEEEDLQNDNWKKNRKLHKQNEKERNAC